MAQPGCAPCDPAANAEAHARAVRVASAQVVVFPELSLTGYEFDAPAITPDDERLAPIVDACAATGSVALVGAPVAGEGGARHIGVLAVDGDGATVAYRKMFLGDAEAACFAPGTAPGVVGVGGWRLGLAVCKDTGVAQHAADTAALGIDVYVAGTVKLPAEAQLQDELARRVAVTHGVWVAVASCAGPTGGGYAATAGCSTIWAPSGIAVARAGPEIGAVVRAHLA